MRNRATKESKRQSVLVDFYNLPLAENARKDKPEILKFFERYAPEVARQDISDAISQGYTKSDDPKPATVFSIKGTNPIFGTLGTYEYFHQGISWFDSPDTVFFYDLYKLAHRVVDNYLSEKEIPRDLFKKVFELTDNIRTSLIAINSKGEQLGSATIPESVNRREYSFAEFETINFPEAVVFSADGRILSQLNLGGLRHRLFRDIIRLWNGEIKLRKCAFEGGERNPPCKNVLISIRGQRYCAKKCYDKARRLRRYHRTGE